MNDTTNQTDKAEAYGPEDRLTRVQAAEVLGVTPRRLDQLRILGDLTTERNVHTGAVRFRFQDVADLRDRRATEVEVQ